MYNHNKEFCMKKLSLFVFVAVFTSSAHGMFVSVPKFADIKNACATKKIISSRYGSEPQKGSKPYISKKYFCTTNDDTNDLEGNKKQLMQLKKQYKVAKKECMENVAACTVVSVGHSIVFSLAGFMALEMHDSTLFEISNVDLQEALLLWALAGSCGIAAVTYADCLYVTYGLVKDTKRSFSRLRHVRRQMKEQEKKIKSISINN